MSTLDFEIMSAEPGEHVEHFAQRMLRAATIMQCIVLGEHNQHTLEARPGMSTKDILSQWDESCRQSFGSA